MSKGLSSSISRSVSSSGNSSTRMTTAPTCRLRRAGMVASACWASTSISAMVGAVEGWLIAAARETADGRKARRIGADRGAQGLAGLGGGRGARRDQEELSIPNLRRRVGLHEQGRARGGKDGQPTRKVQRLNQGRDHALDPRR